VSEKWATATYEPMAGDHISTACRKAIALAIRGGTLVTFRFNGIPMTVRPSDPPDRAVKRWEALSAAHAAAWRESPEGQAAAAEAERRRVDCQRKTDALVARLPGVVKELGPLVRWCVEFGKAADHMDVEWNLSAVADTIEAAGWREKAHVGRAEADFAGNPQMIGEYIVGQAMACLRKGMPPHPGLTEKFAREAGFLSAP
jgi:hypothetical protein